MKNEVKVTAKPQNIREFLKSRKFLKPFIGILAGGLAGFLYFHFVGCSTGSCPITSHSYNTIMFGGLLGYLVMS
jgi:hypothetical protein